MEKTRSNRLVAAMVFVVELAFYISVTNEQPDESDIVYENIRGASVPCVPWINQFGLLIPRH